MEEAAPQVFIRIASGKFTGPIVTDGPDMFIGKGDPQYSMDSSSMR